ncbi:hypothetical protein RJ639_019524 [Escallonia herrerae]|uniref:Uncharacterized protein n=1 Tax=Escallonia herrerae TaxID=1293975 RepID=A0AA89AIU1_9ASTE|nr:hypothetical protein RJ639_019524 [Escallonia herrerae]
MAKTMVGGSCVPMERWALPFVNAKINGRSIEALVEAGANCKLYLGVGAGILAIPAVTQEAGFLASAVTCIGCWIFMVVTGLLIAEVNVRTMCELGSGGVSLVSMARRTLGTAGVQTAW